MLKNPLIVSLCALLAILHQSLPIHAQVQGRPVITWQNTIGTHYRLDTESRIGLTRGWPRYPNIAFRPDITWLKPTDLTPTIGHFSEEQRYYAFEAESFTIGDVQFSEYENDLQVDLKSLDADALDALERKKAAKIQKRLKTLPRPGKRWTQQTNYIQAIKQADEAGIDLAFVAGQVNVLNHGVNKPVEYMMAKQGAYLKDTFYAAYVRFNTGDLANRKNTIYWEIGNEINSSHRFAMRDLTNGKHVRGHPGHAHDYIEYYLAPAVEALRTAAKDVYGDPSRVKILLGSVSGILKPENQRYLDLILNSTIRGEHAPSLAGKKVTDVIDVMVIHYSNGQRDLLEHFHDKWIATGKVTDFWSTEELGWRGRGDYCVSLVSFKWLEFILQNQWPSSAQPRVIFWGDQAKHYGEVTQGAGALKILGPFLADHPLQDARDELVPETRADMQWIALRGDVDAKQIRYAIHVHPYFTNQAALNGFRIHPGQGVINDKTQIQLQCHVLTMGLENKTITPIVEKEDDALFVRFDPYWELDVRESAIFLLTIQQSQ